MDSKPRTSFVETVKTFYIQELRAVISSFDRSFLLSMILITYRHFQQMQIQINDDLIQEILIRDSNADILKYISPFTSNNHGSQQFYFYFALNILLILNILVRFYTFYSNKANSSQRKGLIYFSFFYQIYSYFIYINSLQASFQETDQSPILAILNILLTFFLGWIKDLHDYESRFEINDFLSKNDSKLATLHILLELLQVTCQKYMGYVPVASLSLIVSSILVVQSIYSIPYKDLRILRINIQLSLINFFVSLAVCISVVVEGNFPFVLTVFVTLPLSIAIGFVIYNSRCQKIIHLFADSSAIFIRDLSQIMKDRINLRKPYIDFYFRFLNSGAKLWYDDYTHSPFSVILESITVHHLLHCSKQQTCFCSKDRSMGLGTVEHLGPEIRLQYLREFMRLSLEYMAQCNSSHSLEECDFTYFAFLFEIMKNDTLCLIHIIKHTREKEKYLSLKNSQKLYFFLNLIESRMDISSLQLQSEGVSSKGEGKTDEVIRKNDVNIFQVIVYDEKMTKCESLLRKSFILKMKMLNSLLESFLDVSQLEKDVLQLQELRSEMMYVLRELLMHNSQNCQLMIMVAATETCLTCSKKLSKFMQFQKKNQIHKNLRSSYFSDDSCVIFATFLNPMGTIKKVSKNFQQLFGFTEDEAIGQNIKILMIHEIAARHDEVLLNFINQNNIDQSVHSYPFLIGKRKDQKIIPIKLRFRINHIGHDDLGVTGWIQEVKDENMHICCNGASAGYYNCFISCGLFSKTFMSSDNFNQNSIKRIKMGYVIPAMRFILSSGNLNESYETILIRPTTGNIDSNPIKNKNLFKDLIKEQIYFINVRFYVIKTKFYDFVSVVISNCVPLNSKTQRNEALKILKMQFKQLQTEDCFFEEIENVSLLTPVSTVLTGIKPSVLELNLEPLAMISDHVSAPYLSPKQSIFSKEKQEICKDSLLDSMSFSPKQKLQEYLSNYENERQEQQQQSQQFGQIYSDRDQQLLVPLSSPVMMMSSENFQQTNYQVQQNTSFFQNFPNSTKGQQAHDTSISFPSTARKGSGEESYIQKEIPTNRFLIPTSVSLLKDQSDGIKGVLFHQMSLGAGGGGGSSRNDLQRTAGGTSAMETSSQIQQDLVQSFQIYSRNLPYEGEQFIDKEAQEPDSSQQSYGFGKKKTLQQLRSIKEETLAIQKVLSHEMLVSTLRNQKDENSLNFFTESKQPEQLLSNDQESKSKLTAYLKNNSSESTAALQQSQHASGFFRQNSKQVQQKYLCEENDNNLLGSLGNIGFQIKKPQKSNFSKSELRSSRRISTTEKNLARIQGRRSNKNDENDDRNSYLNLNHQKITEGLQIREKLNSNRQHVSEKILFYLGLIAIFLIVVLAAGSFLLHYQELVRFSINFPLLLWAKEITESMIQFLSKVTLLSLVRDNVINSKDIGAFTQEVIPMIIEDNNQFSINLRTTYSADFTSSILGELVLSTPYEYQTWHFSNSTSSSQLQTFQSLWYEKTAVSSKYGIILSHQFLLSSTILTQSYLTDREMALQNLLGLNYVIQQIQDEQIAFSKGQINSIYSNSLGSSIMISCLVSLVAVSAIPLFGFAQKKRQQIIKLFATISQEQIQIMIMNLQQYCIKNTLLYELFNRQDSKKAYNPQFFGNLSSIDIKSITKKKNISKTSQLKYFNKSVCLASMGLILFGNAYPILILSAADSFNSTSIQQINLLTEIQQVKQGLSVAVCGNTLLIKMLVDPEFINGEIAQTLNYVDFVELLDQQINEFSATFQNSEFFRDSSYFSSMIQSNLCKSILDSPQYLTSLGVDVSLEKCLSIMNGQLSKGLLVGLHEISPILKEYNQITVSNNQSTDQKLDQIKDYSNLNPIEDIFWLQSYLNFAMSAGISFIKEMNRQAIDLHKALIISLLIFEVFIMVLIYMACLLKFNNLIKQSFQRTKRLLDVIELSVLANNSYVVSYFKKNY